MWKVLLWTLGESIFNLFLMWLCGRMRIMSVQIPMMKEQYAPFFLNYLSRPLLQPSYYNFYKIAHDPPWKMEHSGL